MKKIKKTPIFFYSLIIMTIAVVIATFYSPRVNNTTETTRSASLGINPEPLTLDLEDDLSEEEFYADPVNERALENK